MKIDEVAILFLVIILVLKFGSWSGLSLGAFTALVGAYFPRLIRSRRRGRDETIQQADFASGTTRIVFNGLQAGLVVLGVVIVLVSAFKGVDPALSAGYDLRHGDSLDDVFRRDYTAEYGIRPAKGFVSPLFGSGAGTNLGKLEDEEMGRIDKYEPKDVSALERRLADLERERSVIQRHLDARNLRALTVSTSQSTGRNKEVFANDE